MSLVISDEETTIGLFAGQGFSLGVTRICLVALFFACFELLGASTPCRSLQIPRCSAVTSNLDISAPLSLNDLPPKQLLLVLCRNPHKEVKFRTSQLQQRSSSTRTEMIRIVYSVLTIVPDVFQICLISSRLKPLAGYKPGLASSTMIYYIYGFSRK